MQAESELRDKIDAIGPQVGANYVLREQADRGSRRRQVPLGRRHMPEPTFRLAPAGLKGDAFGEGLAGTSQASAHWYYATDVPASTFVHFVQPCPQHVASGTDVELCSSDPATHTSVRVREALLVVDQRAVLTWVRDPSEDTFREFHKCRCRPPPAVRKCYPAARVAPEKRLPNAFRDHLSGNRHGRAEMKTPRSRVSSNGRQPRRTREFGTAQFRGETRGVSLIARHLEIANRARLSYAIQRLHDDLRDRIDALAKMPGFATLEE